MNHFLSQSSLKRFLFLIIITFSCKLSYSQLSQSNYNKAKKIAAAYTGKEPSFVVADQNLQKFIIAISDASVHEIDGIFEIQKFVPSGSGWSKHKTLEVGMGNFPEDWVESPSLVVINNAQYLFFITDESNRATRLDTKNFYLIDLNLDKSYSLTVVDGEIELESLAYIKNSTIREFLDKEAKKSKYVKMPTAEKFNIDLPQNFKKKYDKVNGRLNFSNLPFKLTPIRYTQKLLSYLDGSIEKIENKDFVVYSSFRDAIILCEKKQTHIFH